MIVNFQNFLGRKFAVNDLGKFDPGNLWRPLLDKMVLLDFGLLLAEYLDISAILSDKLNFRSVQTGI